MRGIHALNALRHLAGDVLLHCLLRHRNGLAVEERRRRAADELHSRPSANVHGQRVVSALRARLLRFFGRVVEHDAMRHEAKRCYIG